MPAGGALWLRTLTEGRGRQGSDAAAGDVGWVKGWAAAAFVARCSTGKARMQSLAHPEWGALGSARPGKRRELPTGRATKKVLKKVQAVRAPGSVHSGWESWHVLDPSLRGLGDAGTRSRRGSSRLCHQHEATQGPEYEAKNRHKDAVALGPVRSLRRAVRGSGLGLTEPLSAFQLFHGRQLQRERGLPGKPPTSPPALSGEKNPGPQVPEASARPTSWPEPALRPCHSPAGE